MKLIQKINRQYISYSFVVLVVAGIALFFAIKSAINDETDEKLMNTYRQIELFEKGRSEELELYPFISFKPDHSGLNGRYYSDTILKVKNETTEFRQLMVYTTIQGVNYKVTIRESGIESDDLLESLTTIILLSFACLLVLLFIINKRISKKVWLPFYGNLEKLKQFSLQSLGPFIPTVSDTEEFKEMNQVLKSLTDKVISDYDNLKKFSENASHELQTPLAVIRSKMEALLEENKLSQRQVEKIQTIYQSVNRLSKINSGLLLLTKIENRQFIQQEQLNLDETIKSQIENFSELMEIKKVKFSYTCYTDWIVNVNKILLEILLNNLFGNAILHNENGGQLTIDLYNKQLKFSNTAKSSLPDSNRLFERFYKGKESGSTGLGLAISKQICLSFGWNITYSFEARLHIFTLTSKS